MKLTRAEKRDSALTASSKADD